jgi:ATP-binding protein involved in chromosome partitioning
MLSAFLVGMSRWNVEFSRMTEATEKQILDALKTIKDGEHDIVSLGMVSGLQLLDGQVIFAIEVDPARGAEMEPLRQQAQKAVEEVPGVNSATVVLTAERAGKGGNGGEEPIHSEGTEKDPTLLPDVGAIIAVASGKGGVGKSTTSVNLALALAADGLTVGLLDADIYGPSMPRLLDIHEEPSSSDGHSINPMEKFGIKCMSIGFLIDEETPVIWRGPMVMSALEQLMRDVNWGKLDVLVVDLPPGTGDAQLTMAQRVPLTGAIIVSTPQDLALADARRGLNMFRKVNVPVFGIIENMSYFNCPHCGERSEIFGHGGARQEAATLSTDFLGEIPLHMEIRETSDGGTPIVHSQPDGEHAKAYRAIASAVWAKAGAIIAERDASAPKIVIQ